MDEPVRRADSGVMTFAHEFLASRRLSAELLTASLGRALTPNETLLLSGSIADGNANAKSDVDLILIGDSLTAGRQIDISGVSGALICEPVSGAEVDVTVISPERAQQLGERFRTTLELMLNEAPGAESAVLFAFDEPEEALLHRLRVGLAIGNAAVMNGFRRRYRLDQLDVYSIAIGLFAYFTLCQDAEGMHRDDDGTSAVRVLQMAVDRLAGALLASAGVTLPSVKWRIRMLRRYQHQVGEQLATDLMDAMFPALGTDATEFGERVTGLAQRAIRSIFERRPELVVPLSAMAEKSDLSRLEPIMDA